MSPWPACALFSLLAPGVSYSGRAKETESLIMASDGAWALLDPRQTPVSSALEKKTRVDSLEKQPLSAGCDSTCLVKPIHLV